MYVVSPRYLSNLILGIGLAVVLGCTGQPSEDLQDGGVNGVPRPVITGVTEGVGPLNDNTITVNGTAQPNATIDLHSNSSCSAFVTSALADSSGNFSIAVNVSDDSSNLFHAKQTVAAGPSACSSTFAVYVEDSTAIAPTLSSTPVSPANNNSPSLSGTTEANSTIYLYTDAACTVAATPASDNSNGSGAFSIGVSVADDTSTTYYAILRDAALNYSACSAGYTFTEDSTDPPAPNTPVATPAGPANNNAPVFAGTVAEAGVSVRLFSDAGCSTLIASGTADGGGNYSITVNVADDSTTNVYWRSRDAAGNQSACSGAAVTYVEDSGTAVPVITSSTPTSPSSNGSPDITGTAETGATVTLYSNAACTSVLNSGVAVGGAFTINVTVPADATTTIYAKSVDGIGNTSACTTSAFNYVEDSTPPSVPTLTGTVPASPSNDETPDVEGSTEAGATVYLYSDACTTQIATGTADGSGDFSINVSLANNASHTIYASASDAAGNGSACSAVLNFVEDSVAPSQPTGLTSVPHLRSDLQAAAIEGSAEALATVNVYSDSGCTAQVGTDAADGLGAFSAAITAPLNQIVTYYANATDAAGNSSACSVSSVSYEAYTIPVGVGFFTGTQTNAGATPTNLNQAANNALQYSVADFHSATFTHSLSSNPHRIYVDQAGDYQVSLSVPGTGAVTAGALRMELWVNGTANNATRAQNYYSSNASGHRESSIGATYLLENLNPSDYIEAIIRRHGAAGTIVASGKFGVYVEKIDSSRVIFKATAASGLTGGNINSPNTLAWTSTIKDSGFTHTNGQGGITLDSVGTYVIHANVPATGAVTSANVKVVARINGTDVAGAEAKQGFIGNGSGQTSSSMHWSGLITTSAPNSVLTFRTEREAAAGVVTVPTGNPASVFIERLGGTTDLFFGQGTNHTAGADFNAAGPNAVTFTTENLEDGARFIHDAVTNADQVQVTTAGDYLLMFNAQNTGAGVRVNTAFQVTVNGAPVSGAESKSFFLRNSGGHAESSGTMVFLLRRLNANDIVRVTQARDTTVTTATTNQNTSLILIRKP